MHDPDPTRPEDERALFERILRATSTIHAALERARERRARGPVWRTIGDALDALGDGREAVLDAPFHRPLRSAPRDSEPYALAWVQLALALELDAASAQRLYDATVPSPAGDPTRRRFARALAEAYTEARRPAPSPAAWGTRARELGLCVLDGPRALERWIERALLAGRAAPRFAVEQPAWLEPCALDLVSAPPLVRERALPARARLEWAASGELLGRLRLNEGDLGSTSPAQLAGATVLVHEREARDAVRLAVRSIQSVAGSVELALAAEGAPSAGRGASAPLSLGALRIVVLAP